MRAPRSSLAVGRRFRLLARSPLLGAGVRPKAPSGFRVIGRGTDAQAPPESPHEKFLLLPSLDGARSRDLAWAEARWAADCAAEDTLLLSMMLPTETAPERKSEAQRLHERALKLYSRVDALGPAGVGDPRSMASDVRSALEPVLGLLATCRRSQEAGELHGLAWPTLLKTMEDGLSHSLDRMDGALEAAAPAATPTGVFSVHAPRLARWLRITAHMLDPEEATRIARCTDLAGRLVGQASTANALVAKDLLRETADLLTGLVRDVEAAQVKGILSPRSADRLRREAMKALDEAQRAGVDADRNV